MSEWQFFDRDISWLSFNGRVLMEAANKSVPLLERFKFLSIFSSNLDEFYRVRMPALMAVEKINKGKANQNIYRQATDIINSQQEQFGLILNNELIPELKQSGYIFLNNDAIPASIFNNATNYFFTHIAGLIQPVLLSPEIDFFPENNQLYLAAIVQYGIEDEQLFLINIPCGILPRFYKTAFAGFTYILFLEDIICENLRHLFKDGTIKSAYNIKITRDAALDLEDEYEEDLAEKIEKQLKKEKWDLLPVFYTNPISRCGIYKVLFINSTCIKLP